MIRVILILVIVYYAFKLIWRYLFPFFVAKTLEKVEKKMQQQQQYGETPQGSVGETIIDKKPNNTNQSNKNVGEYIDFEEIE